MADVGVEGIELVENRPATFAVLRRAGFPVPVGAVLTTEALADALVAAEFDGGARQAATEAMSLSTNLRLALATAAEERLGGYRLALRSSIVDESRGSDRIGRDLVTDSSTATSVP